MDNEPPLTQEESIIPPDQKLPFWDLIQKDWEQIPQPQRSRLIEQHGQPITLANTSIEITERQAEGTCDANEKSLLAMEASRIHWGRYDLSLINGYIIYYNLGAEPRIVTSKLFIGADGGFIVPGIVYTEKLSTGAVLGNLAHIKGTHHQAHRGSFRTLYLPNNPPPITLTPIKQLETNPDAVKNLSDQAASIATEHEQSLYNDIYPDLPAYFDNTESVYDIRLTNPLIAYGEINAHDPKSNPTVFDPGTRLKAIKDPISWNNRGATVFIINHDGKYFACPQSYCETIS